jgi:hypothetical protein
MHERADHLVDLRDDVVSEPHALVRAAQACRVSGAI